MPTDLPYGYKKPKANEPGRVFFVTLEEQLDRIASHNHNGENSSLISSASIQGVFQDLSASGWVSMAAAGQPGTYRQLVTLPSSLQYGKTAITFYKQGLDFQVMLTTERDPSAATRYYVYTNDSTLALTVVYTT
jgi:hypothetical protein